VRRTRFSFLVGLIPAMLRSQWWKEPDEKQGLLAWKKPLNNQCPVCATMAKPYPAPDDLMSLPKNCHSSNNGNLLICDPLKKVKGATGGDQAADRDHQSLS